MNLISAFGNNIGVKLPEAPEDFPTTYYPVPESYICIYTGGDTPSTQYDFYNKSIDLVRHYLQANNIQIVQIGIKENRKINGAIDLTGQGNFRQNTFIVENALLMITGQSVWAEVAAYKKIPLILLVAAIPARSATPHYSDKVFVLEPPRINSRPHYSDSDKEINNILPEAVSKTISEALNLSYTKIKTKKIGRNWGIGQIDYLPNCQPQQFTLPSAARMDQCYNLQNLAGFLQLNRAAIVTKVPIDIRFLLNYKSNISEIIYQVDSKVSVDWVATLHKSGIKYILITKCEGQEFADIKFKLFDFNQCWQQTDPDLTGLESADWFESNRIYHSNNKPYLSLYHAKHDILPENGRNQIGNALSDPDFLECVDNAYFFSQE